MNRSLEGPRLDAPPAERAMPQFRSEGRALATTAAALVLGLAYLCAGGFAGLLFIFSEIAPTATEADRWLLAAGTLVGGAGAWYLLRAAHHAAHRRVPGRRGAVALAVATVVWIAVAWMLPSPFLWGPG